MDDAGAELGLRGEEFPTHLVTAEVEQLTIVPARWLNLLELPPDLFNRIGQ
jgi:hypothetical protein